MGIQAPFLYDAIQQDFNTFDPHTKASLASKPNRRSHHNEGPLVNSTRNSFASSGSPKRESLASVNFPSRKSFLSEGEFTEHPATKPNGNTEVKAMKPWTKMVVKRTRVVQLVLRIGELIGAVGLLVLSLLITNIPTKTALIIRIPPGVAILHTVYGIYHLQRPAGGRAPGSTASYMGFAACFDLSLLPFYFFTSALSEWQHKQSLSGTDSSQEWSTALSDKSSLPKLTETTFLLAAILGGLHLISLIISCFLGYIFMRINQLPPDMNPLEDNLTSRHRKKGSSQAEKRLHEPLENKRSSGAPYEDLLRPPTLPFLSIRNSNNSSVDSFSTYHSNPPPSRDSPKNRDLLSRQYQIPAPRSSLGPQTPLNPNGRETTNFSRNSSYTAIPLNDDSDTERKQSSSKSNSQPRNTWFGSDSISKTKKPAYEPIAQQSFESFDFSFPKTRNSNRQSIDISTIREESRDYSSRKSIDSNRTGPGSKSIQSIRSKKSTGKSAQQNGYGNDNGNDEMDKESVKGKYYGDLKPGTPPVMIVKTMRQISTGRDAQSSFKLLDRRSRDVSGKMAEEGRSSWGDRLRRFSGVRA